MELPNLRPTLSDIFEPFYNRASNSSLAFDATYCFLGSQDLLESNFSERYNHSFQEIEISFAKQSGLATSIELPTTSSTVNKVNHLVALDTKPSTTTKDLLLMNSPQSSPVEEFDIYDLMSDYTKGTPDSENTYSGELVWEHLPLDLPVQVEVPLVEKNHNIPKIQKKIKKSAVKIEGDANKTSRRNSNNYAYYSNAGDSQKKKNRNLPGIFRDRFINKLYYIINKEKILSTTQNDVMRNYKKLAVKDADIKFIYNELVNLSEVDFSDLMRFLNNYQQDLDEYKYFDMCRKYRGWHDIQTDSSLESPSFYNYMKKIFGGRITEEAWSNYVMYTSKQNILNSLEHVLRSAETSEDFMFKNWKENKTWKKLRDLCTLDGYGNAPFFFWRLMEQYLSQNVFCQEDEVDREIFSELFLKEFKIEVSRYCQLKYYLKKK